MRQHIRLVYIALLYEHGRMNIRLVCVGKTSASYLQAGIALYAERLRRYSKFSLVELETPGAWSRLPPGELLRREGELLLKHSFRGGCVYRFDERGQSITSPGLARLIDNHGLRGESSLAFLIGGAFGFSEEVKAEYPHSLSLSPLTFNHQMVRLIAVEQIYRAFTIIRGEPYHHG